MNHHGKRGGERSGRNTYISTLRVRKGSWVIVPSILIALASAFAPAGFTANATGNTVSIPDAGFEDGTFTGWNRGTQTGTLGETITGSGTGVTIFTGPRTFTHGARGAVGSPSSPYYASAVAAGSWTFSPKSATKAVLLQPKSEQTFSQAASALNLSAGSVTEINNTLTTQAQASGNGQGNPTDAAWITREVELTADTVYAMAWNYVGTDYVPYNDGSITSLVPITVSGTPVVTVNNYVKPYALLGFTNPGTGDYSTNSFGSTGWQTSTYQVSISGTYKLGFASFNLDDTGLPPALMVDSEIGSTQQCAQAGSCAVFGGVEPNNETAPTTPPTTTTEPAPATTTTTLPPATSLEVTSLDDTASQGTLRWAITQANAQSGGIYDSITFASGLEGTITLTSDLPAIAQSVSITGNGMTSTIIDGNNLYRPIYNNGQRTIAISNMTLKNGKAATGGLAWANQGTFTVTNVKFSNTPNYAWYQQNQTVTTFDSCIFANNYAGIRSDYGSTPVTKSLTDSDYQNRVYINNSQFLNNTYGLATERFVKIENSVFSGNTQTAAQTQGLNRIQVTGSTFTNNGTGVSLFSYIPAGWTQGTDNQLVDGNTFTGNSLAINVNNYFNNGTKIYNGVYANSWSTSTNNTFDNNNSIYAGSDFVIGNNTVVTTTTTTTSTTTTTIPEETTTVAPEPVPAIPDTTVSVPSVIDIPVSVPLPAIIELPITETGTTIAPTIPGEELPFETPTSQSNPEDNEPITSIPQYAPEDEAPTATIPEVVVPEDVQDAADTAVADIFDGPMSNAGIADAVDDLVADAETPEQLTAVVSSLLDQELTDTQFSTVIDSVFDGPMSDENFSAAVDTVFADTSTLSDEQFDTAVQAVFDGPLSTEQFGDALEAVFSEPLSDEKFDAIIDAVLDEPLSDEQFTEVVGILESDAVSEEQVAAAVDQILENEVTADQATELATSEKVLESVDSDQAAEIFDAIPVDELTSEEEAALVAAVTNAPEEVKNAFESTIDIFAEGLDEYVAVGSQVDVGTRRSLIAASAVVSAMTTVGAAGAGSGGPSGPSSNGNGGGGGGGGNDGGKGNSNGTTEGRSKKEEEGEQEAAGEIAGPEEDEDKKPFTRNSIFKYMEN